MVDYEEMSRFLFDLERGSTYGCYTIKEAYDSRKSEYLMGVYYPTPEEIEQIYTYAVNEVKSKLMYWEVSDRKKEVDHYWRYFHGLTILGISEKSQVISESSTNVKQRIAYELWKLDDGEDDTEEILTNVAWCFAEAFKNRKDMSHMLQAGWRHQYGRKKRVHKSLMENKFFIRAGINLQDKEVVEKYVDGVCSKLESERMNLEKYTQYLHALTLLGVPKKSEKVPAIDTNNAMYDIAYELWVLDTSEKNWKVIERIVAMYSKMQIAR